MISSQCAMKKKKVIGTSVNNLAGENKIGVMEKERTKLPLGKEHQ